MTSARADLARRPRVGPPRGIAAVSSVHPVVLRTALHREPNPWRGRETEAALTGAMMAAGVKAGLRKVHLDPSMGGRGAPPALDDATPAFRAARHPQPG